MQICPHWPKINFLQSLLGADMVNQKCFFNNVLQEVKAFLHTTHENASEVLCRHCKCSFLLTFGQLTHTANVNAKINKNDRFVVVYLMWLAFDYFLNLCKLNTMHKKVQIHYRQSSMLIISINQTGTFL